MFRAANSLTRLVPAGFLLSIVAGQRVPPALMRSPKFPEAQRRRLRKQSSVAKKSSLANRLQRKESEVNKADERKQRKDI